MTYAIVEDGIVTNIADATKPIEPNWHPAPLGSRVAIGDTYLNGCFYSPNGTLRLAPDTEQIALALEAMMGGVADA